MFFLLRPSDDAVTYSFHIPTNAMMIVEFNHTIKLLKKLKNFTNVKLIQKLNTLLADLTDAFDQNASIKMADGSEYYVYEMDGYGKKHFLDYCWRSIIIFFPYG